MHFTKLSTEYSVELEVVSKQVREKALPSNAQARTHVCTHVQMDGQLQNIMPPAPPTGWAEA